MGLLTDLTSGIRQALCLEPATSPYCCPRCGASVREAPSGYLEVENDGCGVRADARSFWLDGYECRECGLKFWMM